MAAITACVLLRAGWHLISKRSSKDLTSQYWMRNVQLSLLSVPFGIAAVYMKHSSQILPKMDSRIRFFAGIWWFNATGGLLVAVVVKYADNILKKGFACSWPSSSRVWCLCSFRVQLVPAIWDWSCFVIGSILWLPAQESQRKCGIRTTAIY